MAQRHSLSTIDLKIEALEAEIQRVEVKFPLYARQLRTRLVRYRIQRETIAQAIQAQAELDNPSSDNFADGGRRHKK